MANWLERGINATIGLPYQLITRAWYAMEDDQTELWSKEGILAPELVPLIGAFMGDHSRAKYASDISRDIYDKKLSGTQGFILDTLLDPSTYMTFGTSGFFKGLGAAARNLNRAGGESKHVRNLMVKHKAAGSSYDKFVEELKTLPEAKTNRRIKKVINMNRGGFGTTRQAEKTLKRRLKDAGEEVPKDVKITLKDVIEQGEVEELALQFPFLASSRMVIGGGKVGKFLDTITLGRLNKQRGWFSNFGKASLAPAKFVNDYLASPILRSTVIPAMDSLSGHRVSWMGAFLSGLGKKVDPAIKTTLQGAAKAYENFAEGGKKFFQGDFTFQRAVRAANALHPEAGTSATVFLSASKNKNKQLAELIGVPESVIAKEIDSGKTVDDILAEQFNFTGTTEQMRYKMQARAEGVDLTDIEAVAKFDTKLRKTFINDSDVDNISVDYGIDDYIKVRRAGIKPVQLRKIIKKHDGDIQRAFDEIQLSLSPAIDANSDVYKAYQKGQLDIGVSSQLPKRYEYAPGAVKLAWLKGKELRDSISLKLDPLGGASVNKVINEMEFEGQRRLDAASRSVYQDTREIHRDMEALVVELDTVTNRSEVKTFDDLDKVLGMHQQATPQVEEVLAVVRRLDTATGKAAKTELANLDELVERMTSAADLAKIASPKMDDAAKELIELADELRTSIIDLKSSKSKIKLSDDFGSRLESVGEFIRTTNHEALETALGITTRHFGVVRSNPKARALLDNLLKQNAKLARYASGLGADDQIAYFPRLFDGDKRSALNRLFDKAGAAGLDNQLIENLKRRVAARNLTVQDYNELLIEARKVGIGDDVFEETAKFLRIDTPINPEALKVAKSVLGRKILNDQPYLSDLMEAAKKVQDPKKKQIIDKAIRDATAPIDESWLSAFAHRSNLAKRQLYAEDYIDGILREGNKHTDSRLTLMSGTVNKVHRVGDDTVIELQVGPEDMRLLNVSEMGRSGMGVRNMGKVSKGKTVGQQAVRHQVRGTFPKGSQSMASIRKGESIILGEAGLTSRLLDNTIPALDETRALWNWYDRTNALYKGTQTVLNPAFFIRNTLSNFFQTRAAGGSIHNFGAAQLVAARMLGRLPENTAISGKYNIAGFKSRTRAVEKIKSDATNVDLDARIASRFDDGAELIPIYQAGDTPMGEDDLFKFFAERGLFNDLKVTEELRVAGMNPDQFVAALKRGDESVMESIRDSAAAVEIHNRLSAAMTLILDGKSPELALKKALDVHGDYSKLSKFERDWGRRLAAFYTFSRRVLPQMAKSIDKDPRMLSTIAKLSHNTDWIGVDQYGTLKIEHEGLEMNLSSIALPVEAAAMIVGTIDSINSFAGIEDDVTPLGLGQPRGVTGLAGGGAAGFLFSFQGMDPHREAGLRAGAEYTIQAQSFTRAAWKYAKAVSDDMPLDENLWAAAFLPVKIRKDPSYRRNQRIKIGDALIREVNFQISRTNNPDKIRKLKQAQVQILKTRNSLLKDLR